VDDVNFGCGFGKPFHSARQGKKERGDFSLKDIGLQKLYELKYMTP